ncbi:MAG: hypothetical protein PHO64_13280 [Thiomonas sp.]|nr:hypothetical protein [Thiomonas sp.]
MKLKLVAVFAAVFMAPAALAGTIGSREHNHTTEHGYGTRSTVAVPLAPVLGKALTAADLPEAAALRPCAAGWPVSPLFDRSRAQAWAAAMTQAACVVNATETALASTLTRRTWPNPDALQRAAYAAAKRIDLRGIRAACPMPDPETVVPISGDEVAAQIGAVAVICDAEGVTVTRAGATIFGGGVINGRKYEVSLDQSASGSTSNSTSVGGAFLSP